jgi:3-deoxy-manno-octulosonate cytidylyltransferase (CMP-KDO synthetase)
MKKSNKYIAIIPARYASTRFPGKPLALLGGKPIIQWVYTRVVGVFDETIVATDDERIMKCVEDFGGRSILTSVDHHSGTDRCEEAYIKSHSNCDIIVNVQGDEPFIHPEQLEAIKTCFDDPETEIATLVKPFTKNDGISALKNPNSPKVVLDKNNHAIYFSRSVIPYLRNIPEEKWLDNHIFYKHIGLYAYRADILRKITKMEQTPLELCESLEQLRWIENGIAIKVAQTNQGTIGIDTPEDLEHAEIFLKSQR